MQAVAVESAEALSHHVSRQEAWWMLPGCLWRLITDGTVVKGNAFPSQVLLDSSCYYSSFGCRALFSDMKMA